MQLKIETSKRVELVDITSEVQEEVRKSEIAQGIALSAHDTLPQAS